MELVSNSGYRQLAPNLIGQFQSIYFILIWVKIYKMELTNQIRCELSVFPLTGLHPGVYLTEIFSRRVNRELLP